MKFNAALTLISVWLVAGTAPGFAQGVFVTTVTNSAVSPVGRQDTNVRFVKSEQTVNNGLSVSSDVQRDSSTTTQQGNGSTATDTFNFGSIVTSSTSEKGTTTKTEVFEYSESFEYVDYENFHSVTTGANGDSGPDY
ncbi:MAG: hypothetical protein ACFCU8_09175 [Thermosynechococcaceae cyanobacterium]